MEVPCDPVPQMLENTGRQPSQATILCVAQFLITQL
jgi:hypothetical protein